MLAVAANGVIIKVPGSDVKTGETRAKRPPVNFKAKNAPHTVSAPALFVLVKS